MKRNILYVIAFFFFALTIGCNRISKYPIDDPARVKIDNTLLGKWAMKEDTSRLNYFIIKKKDDFKYLITYMDQGGTHKQYEDFEAFISRVGNFRFLNVQYYYQSVQGYFFLKIIDVNEAGDEIMTANVADSTLSEVTKPAEVRGKITRNINNPAFYSDTAHFVKVKTF